MRKKFKRLANKLSRFNLWVVPITKNLFEFRKWDEVISDYDSKSLFCVAYSSKRKIIGVTWGEKPGQLIDNMKEFGYGCDKRDVVEFLRKQFNF